MHFAGRAYIPVETVSLNQIIQDDMSLHDSWSQPADVILYHIYRTVSHYPYPKIIECYCLETNEFNDAESCK